MPVFPESWSAPLSAGLTLGLLNASDVELSCGRGRTDRVVADRAVAVGSAYAQSRTTCRTSTAGSSGRN